jgi:pilus assembly protein CpaB
MRAVAVSVNAETGIAGFVFPGDHVDVILTHGINGVDSEGNAFVRRASETVLQNVRVLAVDQNTNDQSEQAAIAKTATLELSPKQVEVVSVISELGRLSLSLRSLQKDEQAIAGGLGPAPVVPGVPSLTLGPKKPSGVKVAKKGTYTWDTEVSRLINRSNVKPKTIDVVRGQEAETVEIK